MAEKKSKPKGVKGRLVAKSDSEKGDENPLLHIENKKGFSIETSNLLDSPSSLIFNEYEDFDLKKDKDHFDISRLNMGTQIIIVLRYYEYLCTAKFTFEYILPIMESGLIAKDVFDMIKHSLKNKLLINVPTFDTIFEPDIQYVGKVKYI